MGAEEGAADVGLVSDIAAVALAIVFCRVGARIDGVQAGDARREACPRGKR